MTEFEMVIESKTNGKCALDLFKRYEPLVMKCYKNFLRRNPNCGFTYDDYNNEAFIVMMVSVNQFKPERIKVPENWKFVTHFQQALRWKNNYFFTNVERRHSKTGSFSSLAHDDLKENDILDQHHHSSKDYTHNEVAQKLCIEKFENKLSPQEYKVYRTFCTQKNCKTPTFQDVGDQLGVSKQRISVIVQKMKKKWEYCQTEV